MKYRPPAQYRLISIRMTHKEGPQTTWLWASGAGNVDSAVGRCCETKEVTGCFRFDWFGSQHWLFIAWSVTCVLLGWCLWWCSRLEKAEVISRLLIVQKNARMNATPNLNAVFSCLFKWKSTCQKAEKTDLAKTRNQQMFSLAVVALHPQSPEEWAWLLMHSIFCCPWMRLTRENWWSSATCSPVQLLRAQEIQ